MSSRLDDLAFDSARGDATARAYDALALHYDTQVDGRTDVDNVALRRSFCERVAAAAGHAGLILDFGCGTGTDAAWYVAHGHRVVAYDVSSGMMDRLRERCADEVEAGHITPALGTLEAMALALKGRSPVAAIAANFSVLNHVRELQPLLQLLASHLMPGGALVASVLNPFYQRDMRQAWWWRNALRSAWQGSIRMDGKVTTYRHFMRAIRRAAAPAFVLEEVSAASSGARLGALDSNHLFVVLRKQP